MSIEPTEIQGGAERRRASEMSLKRGRPPTQVPGYEPERFLGVGAYGEVWVAVERNTGRRVAIKFYAHRGGLDWSLLSREVEKLAFLFADRYVVQLLGVGWDADPPYYIMEYLERGSLADRIAEGPLPVEEAVAMLRDVATGLVHAHGKGVLHCDLKPANVLLDQDGKPRLADFGQSRLSTEQAPALGTMFYMAPEQADLEAAPDARWDVYALGALLYCMLTGGPPHRTGETVDEFERTPDLAKRLARYRQSIEQSPPPSGHRKVRGVDKMLAAIVDRCLAADPNKRYANVQAVLDALDARASRLAAAADDGSGGDRAGAAVGGGDVVCLAGVQRGGAAVERGLDGAGLADQRFCGPVRRPHRRPTSWSAAIGRSIRWRRRSRSAGGLPRRSPSPNSATCWCG